MFDGPELAPEMLQLKGRASTEPDEYALIQAVSSPADPVLPAGPTITVELDQSFNLIERSVIEAAIAHFNGSIPKAAAMLKLSPSTIYRKREGWDDLAVELGQAIAV